MNSTIQQLTLCVTSLVNVLVQVSQISILKFLIAALIFSAGYYCARIFFYFVKLFFALPFCRFFDILREIFLTSLG